jgi:hypothetical protein
MVYKNSSRMERALWKLHIHSMHDTLEEDNNVDVIPLGCSENEAVDFCNQFKEKYGKELNYKFENGLCYFSY